MDLAVGEIDDGSENKSQAGDEDVEAGGAPPNAMAVIASPNSVTPGTSALSCFAQSWPPRMDVLQDASVDSTTASGTPSWSQLPLGMGMYITVADTFPQP